jgi:toxin ParE1/3/4
MEMRVVWSALSENQLKEIFDYYSVEANPKTARKIIDKIIGRVSILENNPLAGAKEELLTDYPEDFRYLVESNYKIVYWRKEDMITIASVFDCRQNPVKIKKIR